MTKRSALCALLAAAVGCSSAGKAGPEGPQGVPGPAGGQGPQGPTGEGLTVGADAVTTPAGKRLGVGVAAPAAMLHVGGGLKLDDDASLLPGRNCKQVRLTEPGAGDLGAQLAPHLATARCLAVTLASSTIWTWNDLLSTEEGQILSIQGEGYSNTATTLSVIIQMTANRTFTYQSTDYRDPSRLEVGPNSRVHIVGVRIEETSNDARPLTQQSRGAIFNSSGIGSVFELAQSRVVTSEDVVSVGSRAFFNVLFGWTWIDKGAGAPRDIAAVKSYTGWGYGGGFGFVHASHTTLGTGVTIPASPKISVSN